MAEKIECKSPNCSAKILPATAKRTGGYCMPCKKRISEKSTTNDPDVIGPLLPMFFLSIFGLPGILWILSFFDVLSEDYVDGIFYIFIFFLIIIWVLLDSIVINGRKQYGNLWFLLLVCVLVSFLVSLFAFPELRQIILDTPEWAFGYAGRSR